MGYLHAQGFPVPAIEEMTRSSDLVMERVRESRWSRRSLTPPGPSDDRPVSLAELHRDLHDVAAPDFLARLRSVEEIGCSTSTAPAGRDRWAEGSGRDRLDEHVYRRPEHRRGPGARPLCPRGDRRRTRQGQVPAGRSLLVNGFLSHFDRNQIAGQLRAVVEWKATDLNMSTQEVQTMWNVVERAGDEPLTGAVWVTIRPRHGDAAPLSRASAATG